MLPPCVFCSALTQSYPGTHMTRAWYEASTTSESAALHPCCPTATRQAPATWACHAAPRATVKQRAVAGAAQFSTAHTASTTPATALRP